MLRRGHRRVRSYPPFVMYGSRSRRSGNGRFTGLLFALAFLAVLPAVLRTRVDEPRQPAAAAAPAQNPVLASGEASASIAPPPAVSESNASSWTRNVAEAGTSAPRVATPSSVVTPPAEQPRAMVTHRAPRPTTNAPKAASVQRTKPAAEPDEVVVAAQAPPTTPEWSRSTRSVGSRSGIAPK